MARKKLFEWFEIFLAEFLGDNNAKRIITQLQQVLEAAASLLISFRLTDVLTSIAVGEDYEIFSNYPDPDLCWNHGLTDKIFCYWVQLDSILLILGSILTLLWIFFVRDIGAAKNVRSLIHSAGKVALTVVYFGLAAIVSFAAVATTVFVLSTLGLILKLFGVQAPGVLSSSLQLVITTIALSATMLVCTHVADSILHIIKLQNRSRNSPKAEPLQRDTRDTSSASADTPARESSAEQADHHIYGSQVGLVSETHHELNHLSLLGDPIQPSLEIDHEDFMPTQEPDIHGKNPS